MHLTTLIVAITVIIAVAAAQPIVKVAKALGDHGYNALRISVITDSDSEKIETGTGPFTYDAPFRWKWPQYHLQSYLAKGLIDGPQMVDIGNGATMNISLPSKGSGARGIVFGDPCVEPDFIGCIHFTDGSTMQTRLPRLVNAVAASTDWRAIIGDNFYDQSGDFTGRFYRALTLEAQSKIEITALGNHDLWRPGFPQARARNDSYGNGYLQFYGQDTVLSRDDSTGGTYMDLSVDPNVYVEESDQNKLPASKGRPDSIPPAKNFLSYHTVGNTGFISYSGAHEWDSYEGELEKACHFFDQQGQVSEEAAPKVIILAGHWNQGHLGCQKGMDVPSVYERLRTLPGCDGGKLRYVAGHVHCNEVMQWADGDVPYEGSKGDPIGYMLGGTGVRGENCNTFGFAYFSTTDDRELVVGFTMGTDKGEEDAPPDVFEEAIACFEDKGVANCLEYGTIWRDSSLE